MDEQGGFEGLTPQRNKDDIESLRSELEQARMEIEGLIQENADGINALEQALADKADLSAIPASKRDRVVHWVEGPFNALDTELTCEQIVSTDLAGEVFRDYLVNREDVMPVGVGDILALNCNISRRAEREEFDGERYHVQSFGDTEADSDLEQPLLDEESSESGGSGYEEEEEEEEEILDKIEGCTYLGLVLGTDGLFQDKSPEFTDNTNQVTNEVLHDDIRQRIQRIYEGEGGDRKVLYEILVWSTCTNSGGLDDDCPDEVEGVRIKELVPPESGSSEKEEHLSYIYDPMQEGSEGASNMILSRLKSLAEGEVSGSDTESTKFIGIKINPSGDEEGNFESLTHLEQKRESTAIGLSPIFTFQDIQIKPKSIEADIEEVSLRSTPLEFWSKQFDKKSLEVKDVSIYSDKCGKLGLEKELSDGESETLELLAQSGDYGSSKVSIFQHTFKKKEYDGDEEEEPVTVADLSKVSIYQREGAVSPGMGARSVWWPMIPFNTKFSGDQMPDESADGEKFITVKDITVSLYSSTVSIATGEDYGKQVRQIHLQIAKEIMHNQFYSGLWCGSRIPPEGPQPEYIDLYANIPLSVTDGFTGDKQVFIQRRHPESGDLLDPSIEVSLGDIDTENHERTLTVSREEVIEPVTISLGLVKEFGFESDIDLPMTGMSTVKIPASEFDESIHIKTPISASIFTPEYGTESGSGSESESAPSNTRTLRITYKNEFIDTKSGLVVDRRIPDSPASHYSTLEANFEVASVSLGISIAGFTGELLYQGVNQSAQKPKLEVKWANSLGDVANMRAIEVIQTDVVGKAKVESGLIKKEETGEQEEPLVTKGSLNIPYSDFDGSFMNFNPVSIGTYEYTPPDTGSGSENSGPVQRLKIDYQVSIFGVKHGLLTGENNTYPDSFETDLPSSVVGGTDFSDDISYDITDKVSIFTIEPESDADEGVTKIGIGLKTNRRTIKTEDGLITDDIVAETQPVKIYTSEIDLPVPTVSVAGTDFTNKIPLANQFWSGIYREDGTIDDTNPLNDALPADHQFALDSEHLYFRIPVGLASYKRKLDVDSGLIEDLVTDSGYEKFTSGGDISFRIPKVSLGITQGITDTINSPTLGGVTVTKTANSNTGGETVRIQANHANNFYEVENGLIKEVSEPATTASDTDVSFEIPPAGGGAVSLGGINADPLTSISALRAVSQQDGSVQLYADYDELKIEDGLITARQAFSAENPFHTIPAPGGVSGFTEKTMLVCDEDGNSRVITVLAKE